jgi:membrane protein implicated in regulation of membrane protease activity
MLARMLRKILLFQAGFVALMSAAAAWLMAWLADWPWWAGLVVFALLPM